MAEKLRWGYERLKEDGKIEYAPSNDYDGKITGHIVFGVKQFHPRKGFPPGFPEALPR